MDPRHRFHTAASYRWVRLEYLLLCAGLAGLLAWHHRGVRVGPLVLSFVLIDAVGYAPGALAYRRGGGRRVAPLYHHLYNLTHSFVTAAAALLLWALCIGRLEWAMLAVPLHLAGDRGIFGNIYKPVELPFEPGRGPIQESE